MDPEALSPSEITDPRDLEIADLKRQLAEKDAEIMFQTQRADRAEKKAISDTLGVEGVLNKLGFIEKLGQEFELAKRNNEPLSLVFIDLNNFKRVNDLHGHEEGDKVLKHILQILMSSLRTQDIRTEEERRHGVKAQAIDTVGRWGGDEIAVALSGVDMESAIQIMQRVRKYILGTSLAILPNGQGKEYIEISGSIGIATMDQDVDSATELLRQADAASYKAKRHAEGKNTIAVWSGGDEQTTALADDELTERIIKWAGPYPAFGDIENLYTWIVNKFVVPGAGFQSARDDEGHHLPLQVQLDKTREQVFNAVVEKMTMITQKRRQLRAKGEEFDAAKAYQEYLESLVGAHYAVVKSLPKEYQGDPNYPW